MGYVLYGAIGLTFLLAGLYFLGNGDVFTGLFYVLFMLLVGWIIKMWHDYGLWCQMSESSKQQILKDRAARKDSPPTQSNL